MRWWPREPRAVTRGRRTDLVFIALGAIPLAATASPALGGTSFMIYSSRYESHYLTIAFKYLLQAINTLRIPGSEGSGRWSRKSTCRPPSTNGERRRSLFGTFLRA